MTRKQPLRHKHDTQPDMRSHAGPAPKNKPARSGAPTEPPPKSKRSKETDTKTSGTRSRRPPRKAGAAVDEEVTADLSKDPRRDREDE